VLEAAQRSDTRETASSSGAFTEDELRAHLERVADAYGAAATMALQEIAASLDSLAAAVPSQEQNLEELERRLTTLEEKAVAILRSTQSDGDLLAIRAALDDELKPYRGKMSADQISMLERRYLDTALLEKAKLPRLSLFYLH
jgi:hypothetical protein